MALHRFSKHLIDFAGINEDFWFRGTSRIVRKECLKSANKLKSVVSIIWIWYSIMTGSASSVLGEHFLLISKKLSELSHYYDVTHTFCDITHFLWRHSNFSGVTMLRSHLLVWRHTIFCDVILTFSDVTLQTLVTFRAATDGERLVLWVPDAELCSRLEAPVRVATIYQATTMKHSLSCNEKICWVW